MRVLIFHNQLWTHYKAGLFSEIASEFDKNKHLQDFLVVQIGLYEKSRSSLGTIDLSLHQYPYQVLFEKALEDIGFWERAIKMLKAIKSHNPNIVNFTGYYDMASWFSILYCKVFGIKIILSNESTKADQSRNFIKEFIKRLLIKRFDGYFCFGTKSAEYLESLGADSQKILVKNAAVVQNKIISKVYTESFPNRETEKLKLGLKPFNFIFVGRFVEVKNLFLLLNAFNQVKNKDWGLVLLGNGHLEESLKSNISTNKISGVKFIAPQVWNQIPSYLSISDVFVLPSKSETWGLVINEAMICKMPIILSNQCGCSIDLIENGKNGFIFESDNQEDLTKKMNTITNANLEEFGKFSQEKIKKFDSENVAKKMYQAFEHFSLK